MGYLRRFLRPSSSSARRASPNDAPHRPDAPAPEAAGRVSPSVDSTAMSATWPHRSGGIGVNDILVPPSSAHDHLCSTPPRLPSATRGRRLGCC